MAELRTVAAAARQVTIQESLCILKRLRQLGRTIPTVVGIYVRLMTTRHWSLATTREDGLASFDILQKYVQPVNDHVMQLCLSIWAIHWHVIIHTTFYYSFAELPCYRVRHMLPYSIYFSTNIGLNTSITAKQGGSSR